MSTTVQQTSPFGAGPVVLPSTLEVVGATQLDSTLEVKGATQLDTTLDVKGNATLEGQLAVTGASSLDAGTITTNGVGHINVQNISYRSSTNQFFIQPGAVGSQWILNFPSPAAGRTITFVDPGVSPVGLLYTNSAAGQSLTGGLTADSLILTSGLQFSIGAGTLQSISGTLSTTDLSNLFTAPKNLISAPGAGNFIFPVFIAFEYIWGTANITGGGGGVLQLQYGNASGSAAVALSIQNDTLISGASVSAMQTKVGTSAALPSTSVLNQTIAIGKTTASFTMGTSTGSAKYNIWYTVHTGF